VTVTDPVIQVATKNRDVKGPAVRPQDQLRLPPLLGVAVTTFPLPDAHVPLRSAIHIPEARGGEGANALAAVITFDQSSVAAGGTEPMPASPHLVSSIRRCIPMAVSPWRAEEVFRL
jgi:hypothetical protein